METPARSRRTLFSLAIGAVVAGLVLAGDAATAGQSGKAAAGTPAAGTVTGTLTMDKVTVKLTHAYAGGPIDGDRYVVELTDQALPDAAVAGELKYPGGQRLLRAGTASGVLLYVDAKGFVVTAIPFAGETRGSKMLASVGSMTSFKVAAGQASGTGKLSVDDTNQGWSYQAQFSAPVRAVK